ncbi:MAG: LA_1612 family putative O-antigen biosynthesis protein [Ilumatobacteraceae bacterium]
MTRLARVIRTLRSARWTWRRPASDGVLVFDRYASDPITALLRPGTYDVFDNHFEEINVPILLRTILRGGRSWYDYCRNFVAVSRPRLLVSAIDSNAHLYTFRHVSPSTRVVVVQNGIRGTGAPVPAGDLWTTLRRDFSDIRPAADLVLTFGPDHSAMYRSHIECATAEIGSAKNNSIALPAVAREPGRIVFISQYSGLDHVDIFPDGRASATLTYLGERAVSASVFHSVDGQVARALAALCSESGMRLTVIGRRPASFRHEREFFAQWCAGKPFEFVPKGSETASYEIASSAEVVACVDSTLGYEMLSRGRRVAFVAARGAHLRSVGCTDDDVAQFRFGFPSPLAAEGAFWTSSDGDADVRRVVDFARASSDDAWSAVAATIVPRVMTFDPGNVRIRAALAERGAVLAQ